MGGALWAAAPASSPGSAAYQGPLDSLSLARVVGAGPARFAPSESSSAHAYVLPGDEVVVSSVEGGLSCVTFLKAGQETHGWLPTRRLRTVRTDRARRSAWA